MILEKVSRVEGCIIKPNELLKQRALAQEKITQKYCHMWFKQPTFDLEILEAYFSVGERNQFEIQE